MECTFRHHIHLRSDDNRSCRHTCSDTRRPSTVPFPRDSLFFTPSLVSHSAHSCSSTPSQMPCNYRLRSALAIETDTRAAADKRRCSDTRHSSTDGVWR